MSDRKFLYTPTVFDFYTLRIFNVDDVFMSRFSAVFLSAPIYFSKRLERYGIFNKLVLIFLTQKIRKITHYLAIN